VHRASEEAKDRFKMLIPDVQDVAMKAMFGNLGTFVNANMFAGLFSPHFRVALPAPDNGRGRQVRTRPMKVVALPQEPDESGKWGQSPGQKCRRGVRRRLDRPPR
jgi:hypothetical protein